MVYKYFGPKPSFAWLQVGDTTTTTTPTTPTSDPLGDYLNTNRPVVAGEVTIAGPWKKDPTTGQWVPSKNPDEDPTMGLTDADGNLLWAGGPGAWQYVGPQPTRDVAAAAEVAQYSEDADNWNVLASYIKDAYPTLTANALFQGQANQVAKFFQTMNQYQPSADALWTWQIPATEAMAEQLGVEVGTPWSPLHQALGVAAEGWGRMPAVFGLVETAAVAPTEPGAPTVKPSTGDVGSVAAPIVKPQGQETVTYIRNTVFGPKVISRPAAMYFTRLGKRDPLAGAGAKVIVEEAVEGVSNAMSKIFGLGGPVKLGNKPIVATTYKEPPKIPMIRAEQLPQMLTPPPAPSTGGGGGGSTRKIVFDPAEVKLYVEQMWRKYLLTAPSEQEATRLADQYIDKATSFYASGGNLDIEAWAVGQIRQAPRYPMIYRSKPPDVDELEFLSGFQNAASQSGLTERSRAGQIVQSTSAGAGAQGLFNRASRSRDVFSQNPSSFLNRLAENAAQTIGVVS